MELETQGGSGVATAKPQLIILHHVGGNALITGFLDTKLLNVRTLRTKSLQELGKKLEPGVGVEWIHQN